MLTTQAMGQLKERERDAETNRNLEQWIKENAALGKHVTMQRSVLGDPPVRLGQRNVRRRLQQERGDVDRYTVFTGRSCRHS